MKKGRKSSGRRASRGLPHPVDVWVGERIRGLRIMKSMSQSVLAEAIGLTFQQVQKYERGANRVSSSRLFDLAQILGVEIAYFFRDMPAQIEELAPGAVRALSDEEMKALEESIPRDSDMRRETMILAKAYEDIRDPELRRTLRKMVVRLADVASENGTETKEEKLVRSEQRKPDKVGRGRGTQKPQKGKRASERQAKRAVGLYQPDHR